MSDDTKLDQLARAGQRFYDERLRVLLEPEHDGRFVAIDPDAELYAVSDEPIGAHEQLAREGSEGLHVLLRVGHPATYEMYSLR